jgi:hypothetical protein
LDVKRKKLSLLSVKALWVFLCFPSFFVFS